MSSICLLFPVNCNVIIVKNAFCMTHVCGYKGDFKVCGVLGVEHFGRKSDGFCITLLVQTPSTELGKTGKGSSYHWTAVTDASTALCLKNAVMTDFGCSKFKEYGSPSRQV